MWGYVRGVKVGREWVGGVWVMGGVVRRVVR